MYKRQVLLGGRPLIAYPLAAVEAAGLEPVVVAKADSRLPALDVPVWREPEGPSHPLCGIVAALRQAGGRAVVAVGCDMPFVTAALVARLASLDVALAAPLVDGAFEPLLARYEPSLVRALDRALDGRAPMREAIAALGPAPLREAELATLGDPERLLFNVNTPHDLERAERDV